jgi:hypothetical protein
VLSFVAVLLSLLLTSAPSLACVPPAERAVYQVDHETFGNIGRQVLTFSCSGDRLVVDTTVDVAVQVLLVTLYRRRPTIARSGRAIASSGSRAIPTTTAGSLRSRPEPWAIA